MNTSITTRPITAMVLLPLLAAASLVLTNLPARATPPGNGGYLAMQVADLPGAVHFFRIMLNCAPVDASAGTSQAALLDCGNGNIVSLTRGSARVSHEPVGSLTIDDASATTKWLCSHDVRIAGGPSIVTGDPGLHQVVVTLVTPWGQPLRLVSYTTNRTAWVSSDAACQCCSTLAQSQ